MQPTKQSVVVFIGYVLFFCWAMFALRLAPLVLRPRRPFVPTAYYYSKLTKTTSDDPPPTLQARVRETTKTGSYLMVILLGVGVCGGLFYTVLRELFSSTSPNQIYSKTVELLEQEPRVTDKLGYPLKAHGEETRRGRRQHVSHVYYQDKDNRKHMRMKFYVQGSAHGATANLDMIESEAGQFDYRYLFLEVDDMFKSVIVVKDNRK